MATNVIKCDKRRIHRCDGPGGIILPIMMLVHLGFGCGGKRRGPGVAGATPSEGGREILSSHRGDHRKVLPGVQQAWGVLLRGAKSAKIQKKWLRRDVEFIGIGPDGLVELKPA